MRIVKYISLSILIVFICGCVMLRGIENDFSGIGKDVFSSVIIDSSPSSGRGYGYQCINFNKMQNDFVNRFNYKDINYIVNEFENNGGSCVYNDKLECKISKYWRLIRESYPSYGFIMKVDNVLTPGINLVFLFDINSGNLVTLNKFECFDITIRNLKSNNSEEK